MRKKQVQQAITTSIPPGMREWLVEHGVMANSALMAGVWSMIRIENNLIRLEKEKLELTERHLRIQEELRKGPCEHCFKEHDPACKLCSTPRGKG